MLDYLSELFLSEYFAYEVILGDYGIDSEYIFRRLCDVFLLSEEQQKTLKGLVASSEVKNIVTEKDYYRYLRLKKYSAMYDVGNDGKNIIDDIIAVKGGVITAIARVEPLKNVGMTSSETGRILLDLAADGNIRAIRMVGFLTIEGEFLQRDVKMGIKYFNKASSWNDIKSMFLTLFYDKTCRKKTISNLYFALNNASHGNCFAIIENSYGKCEKKGCTEAVLLEKVFRQGAVQRDVYSAQYARVLFSDAITLKDKEKLLLSSSKESVAEISNLPFKLSPVNMTVCDISGLKDMTVKRDKELSEIKHFLTNSDMRTYEGYRPFCLSSKSMFMLGIYADAIARCSAGAHIVKIDVNETEERDFEPTKNNIFIRSCEEDKENIYFIFFKGELSEKKCELVKTFLKSRNRNEFRLAIPGININLSPILPICFCDSFNERGLRSCCDIVKIEDAGRDEIPCLTEEILRTMESIYGIPKIKLEDEVKSILYSMTIDEAERWLNEIVRGNRIKGQDLFITEKMAANCKRNKEVNRYGFGGLIYEN